MGIPTRYKQVKAGAIEPQYEVLLRWTYKKGESESTGSGKDAQLLRAMVSAGFKPVSYSHTYWSSPYHGWWVFKGTDLDALREKYLQAVQKKKLDEHMTIELTIGRSQSPPFTRFLMDDVPVYEPEIQMTPGQKATMTVEICDLVCTATAADYSRAPSRSADHTFKPLIVNQDPKGVVEIEDRGGLETPTRDSSVTFRIAAKQEGRATLFVGVGEDLEGPALRILVTAEPDQSQS